MKFLPETISPFQLRGNLRLSSFLLLLPGLLPAKGGKGLGAFIVEKEDTV